MTIEELHGTVVEGFKKADERFARIDERFDEIRQEIRQEIREEMRDFRVEIEGRIQEQHETTRRRFDVMVERVETAVRIVAEGYNHLRTVVDNHEVRPQAIEKRV